VEISHRALRVRRRLKDRPLVILEHTQPRVQVARVIRPRLEFRHDAEIGAQEAASELGDKFFASPFGAILVIAGEIASNPVCWRRPVGGLLIFTQN